MVAIGYTSGDERKLSLAGGTMTGALILANDPTGTNEAATKHYVDTAVVGGVAIGAGQVTSGTLDVARIPTGTTSATVAIGDDSRIVGAAQKASNLSDLASVATARNNLGLGTAATMNVGTASGTVAAGNDSRFQRMTPTAVKTAAYTAAGGDFVPVDTTAGGVTITLPTAPADGTQIGVKHAIRGGTNTVTVTRGGTDVFNAAGGSTSVTLTVLHHTATFTYRATGAIWYVISGDLPLSQTDLRYAQLANNLSDLTNAATARTNLGLGAAATRAIGTTSGTVPDGADSRFTDTRTPSALSVTTGTIAAGAVTPAKISASTFGPEDHGYLTWSIDPAYAGTGSTLSAAGVQHMIKVKLPTAATISSIALFLTAISVTATNCFVSLYDSGGTQRGVSANLATTWNGTTGYYEHALTSSYSAAAGTYYVGILCGAAGTLPSFSRNATTLAANAGLTAPGLRFGTTGSGLTAAPASVTLSGVTAASSAAAASYFVGLK